MTTKQPSDAQALSDWLLELREKAELSQEQAAEAIGVSPREIRRWEKTNAPGGVNLIRLLSAYGVRFEQAPPAEIPRAVNAELQQLRLALSRLEAPEGVIAAQGRQVLKALRALAKEVRVPEPSQADTARRASQGRKAR